MPFTWLTSYHLKFSYSRKLSPLNNKTTRKSTKFSILSALWGLKIVFQTERVSRNRHIPLPELVAIQSLIGGKSHSPAPMQGRKVKAGQYMRFVFVRDEKQIQT